MRNIVKKYREIILYLFFGGVTTLINIAAYWACAHKLRIDVMPSAAVAWFLAVLAAYLTNRTWVFQSQAKGIRDIVREMVSFFLCRITTGALDVLLMFLLVECIGFPDMIIKTAANIIVILLNYLASRLVIFNRR